MDHTYLSNLLHAARTLTNADRALVVDSGIRVLQMDNLTEADIRTAEFNQFGLDSLRKAVQTGEAIITNNVITQIEDAPTTNTNFANLRFVVAIPVNQHGALYLDRHISSGVIPRQMIERLMNLIDYIAQNRLENLTADEIIALDSRISQG
jgi:hypothetical protein